jgi:hypothetical protein
MSTFLEAPQVSVAVFGTKMATYIHLSLELSKILE